MANLNQIQLPDGSQYNLKDDISGYATETYVDTAVAGVDKTAVGLGNVDNTSDLDKPVSTAQQTALNAKANNTVIAPVEASTTASRRYEIDEQFILNGILYTATAIIANGGTITVGTNCTASPTLIQQIEEVPDADDITFDNTGTDLVSEDVESAIVEVNAKTSGLTRMTTLWTNPSPTASFSAQNITLSSDDYDFLMVLPIYSSDTPRIIASVTVPKGMDFFITADTYSSGVVNFRRVCQWVNNTTYSVGTAKNNAANDDTVCIPFVIYGVKII